MLKIECCVVTEEKNPLCWDEEAFIMYMKLQAKLKTTEEANKIYTTTPEVRTLNYTNSGMVALSGPTTFDLHRRK